jgi:hypothetical protein
MFSLLAMLIIELRNAFADRRDLVIENTALRQQLTIYQRKGRCPLPAGGRPDLQEPVLGRVSGHGRGERQRLTCGESLRSP